MIFMSSCSHQSGLEVEPEPLLVTTVGDYGLSWSTHCYADRERRSGEPVAVGERWGVGNGRRQIQVLVTWVEAARKQ